MHAGSGIHHNGQLLGDPLACPDRAPLAGRAREAVKSQTRILFNKKVWGISDGDEWG